MLTCQTVCPFRFRFLLCLVRIRYCVGRVDTPNLDREAPSRQHTTCTANNISQSPATHTRHTHVMVYVVYGKIPRQELKLDRKGPRLGKLRHLVAATNSICDLPPGMQPRCAHDLVGSWCLCPIIPQMGFSVLTVILASHVEAKDTDDRCERRNHFANICDW